MIGIKHDRAAAQRIALRIGVTGALALAAAASSREWLARDHPAPPEAMAAVLVAARAIVPGASLTAADLHWQAWPARGVPIGAMVQGRARAAAMTGRIATAALAAGTPITAATFSTPGAGSAFAAAIHPGHRAISIAVGPTAGLAGFIAPGDRVDVLFTQAIGNRRIGQTLLVDIAVLGVDQRQRGESPLSTASDAVAEAMDSAGAPDLVTLEVTPKQAEAIAVAGEMGKLSLVLRGPGAEAPPPRGRSWDTEVTGLPAALFAAPAAVPAAPVAAAPNAATASPPARPDGPTIVYGLAAATPVPAP